MIELSSVLAVAVAESLLHFLWQGTLLGALAFILLRRAGTNAGAKYALGIGTLAAMLLAPIVTTIWILSSAGQANATGPTVGAPTVSSSSLPVAWVLGVWACGAALCGVRLAGGWVVARRMTTRAVKPVADEIQAMATRVAARLSVTTPFRVLESTIAASPMMIGWLKPVVLLPTATLAGLSPSQLEALLAHEFAHMRRHDYLVNLLQSGVETLLFYHPAVWLVSRSVRESREQCCDDLTISVCDRLTYVSALSSVAALRSASPALAAGGGSLRSRVERMLRPQSSVSSSTDSMGWLGIIPVALVLAAAMPMTSASPVSAPQQASEIVAPAPATRAESVSVAVTESTTVTTQPQTQPAPLPLRPALPIVLDFLMPTTQAMPLQAPPPPPAVAPLSRQFAPRPYPVAAGDTVRLDFYNLVTADAEMKKPYLVGADGTILLKHVGPVRVNGMTVLEIAHVVKTALESARIYPANVVQVTAVVTDERPQRVIVQGHVMTPGEKQLRGSQLTASRAIASANGFTPQAGEEIEIRRIVDGKQTVIQVTRGQLNSGDDPPLVAEDMVIVKQGYTFFVNGEVHSAGQKIWSPGMTVARAVAMSNGATEKGDIAGGQIRRAVKEPGTGKVVRYTEIASVLPQTEVLPDDILIVPRQKEPETPKEVKPEEPIVRVQVQGQVMLPGEKPLPGNQLTVSRAIAAANGFTPMAGQDIEIHRVIDNKAVIIRVTRTELDAGHGPRLFADDIVIVKTGYVFFVTGEVGTPGQKIWAPGMTVGKAISMSNGLTTRGKLGHIERPIKDASGKVTGYKQIKALKPETEVRPGDTLHVARKWFGN